MGLWVCIGPVLQELYGILGVYRASSTGTVWDSGCVYGQFTITK